jgi:hypothetical protein
LERRGIGATFINGVVVCLKAGMESLGDSLQEFAGRQLIKGQGIGNIVFQYGASDSEIRFRPSIVDGVK